MHKIHLDKLLFVLKTIIDFDCFSLAYSTESFLINIIVGKEYKMKRKYVLDVLGIILGICIYYQFV